MATAKCIPRSCVTCTTLLLFFATCMVFIPGLIHADPLPPRKSTLVLGKVTNNPKKFYDAFKVIADYAAQKMSDLGITGSEVLLPRDNTQMIHYLRQGKVDWISETPFSAVTFQEKAGAEFLLKRWKKGVSSYHTIFLARKDSDIRTLEDLVGKTIAFEDPGSSSAFYIPASIMLQAGFKLTRLATPREQPPADMIGYVFSREEINSSAWVYRKLVEAAALSNLDWDRSDHLKDTFKPDLSIFHTSRNFPRAIEMTRKDLDPRIRERLRQILLQAHQDPAATIALRKYQKTTRFEEIDADTRASLEEVRHALRLITAEL